MPTKKMVCPNPARQEGLSEASQTGDVSQACPLGGLSLARLSGADPKPSKRVASPQPAQPGLFQACPMGREG